MAKRLLESLRGTGTVYAGGTLLRETHYDISVWADDGVKSESRIEGHIDITGIREAVVLAGADTLTLRLEDGRRLDFTLADTGGKIVGKGSLPPA